MKARLLKFPQNDVSGKVDNQSCLPLRLFYNLPFEPPNILCLCATYVSALIETGLLFITRTARTLSGRPEFSGRNRFHTLHKVRLSCTVFQSCTGLRWLYRSVWHPASLSKNVLPFVLFLYKRECSAQSKLMTGRTNSGFLKTDGFKIKIQDLIRPHEMSKYNLYI